MGGWCVIYLASSMREQGESKLVNRWCELWKKSGDVSFPLPSYGKPSVGAILPVAFRAGVVIVVVMEGKHFIAVYLRWGLRASEANPNQWEVENREPTIPRACYHGYTHLILASIVKLQFASFVVL